MLQAALDLQARAALGTDRDIENALLDVRHRIFSKECENAQRQMDDKLLAVKSAMNSRSYLKADSMLKQALEMTRVNSECMLNSDLIRGLEDSIQRAVNYQSRLLAVLDQQKNKKYSEAMNAYADAGDYYHTNELSRFGISHPSLSSFVSANGSNGFIHYVADMFTGKNELESSLELFRVLSLHNYKNSSFRKSLYRLGFAYAIHDHQSGKINSWKQQALDHTKGDKRLKCFVRGYKKGMKSR